MATCAKCGAQLPDGVLFCTKCGFMPAAPALEGKAYGISSFVIDAAAISGSFERVKYARGRLKYERDSATMPHIKLKKEAPLVGSEYDVLCESFRSSRIESWPLWNSSRLEPIGVSFPRIEIKLLSGDVLCWRNRSIPPSEPWRQAEKVISAALGLDFCIEGYKAHKPAPETCRESGMEFIPALVASRALKSPYVISHVRALRAINDHELDRIYHYGTDGIPGSVVQAVFTASRKHPELSDTMLSVHMLTDKTLVERLTKNLAWENETPELAKTLREFEQLLENERRTQQF